MSHDVTPGQRLFEAYLEEHGRTRNGKNILSWADMPGWVRVVWEQRAKDGSWLTN